MKNALLLFPIAQGNVHTCLVLSNQQSKSQRYLENDSPIIRVAAD